MHKKEKQDSGSKKKEGDGKSTKANEPTAMPIPTNFPMMPFMFHPMANAFNPAAYQQYAANNTNAPKQDIGFYNMMMQHYAK
jgi:hypothetical protein